MKYEITSTKQQTNPKLEIVNSSAAANSDFGFEVSDFKRLKGEQ